MEGEDWEGADWVDGAGCELRPIINERIFDPEIISVKRRVPPEQSCKRKHCFQEQVIFRKKRNFRRYNNYNNQYNNQINNQNQQNNMQNNQNPNRPMFVPRRFRAKFKKFKATHDYDDETSSQTSGSIADDNDDLNNDKAVFDIDCAGEGMEMEYGNLLEKMDRF